MVLSSTTFLLNVMDGGPWGNILKPEVRISFVVRSENLGFRSGIYCGFRNSRILFLSLFSICSLRPVIVVFKVILFCLWRFERVNQKTDLGSWFAVKNVVFKVNLFLFPFTSDMRAGHLTIWKWPRETLVESSDVLGLENTSRLWQLDSSYPRWSISNSLLFAMYRQRAIICVRRIPQTLRFPKKLPNLSYTESGKKKLRIVLKFLPKIEFDSRKVW